LLSISIEISPCGLMEIPREYWVDKPLIFQIRKSDQKGVVWKDKLVNSIPWILSWFQPSFPCLDYESSAVTGFCRTEIPPNPFPHPHSWQQPFHGLSVVMCPAISAHWPEKNGAQPPGLTLSTRPSSIHSRHNAVRWTVPNPNPPAMAPFLHLDICLAGSFHPLTDNFSPSPFDPCMFSCKMNCFPLHDC
jgi:hypothetical protein